MFPQATPAGIVKSSDGERVVASSRRPDGSYAAHHLLRSSHSPSMCRYRKELKIRPGYTPDEDVKRYRTARGAESEARAATKGAVPGLAPAAAGVQAALAGMSKAQKKNVKRKEKRKEDEVEEGEKGREDKEDEDVPESWDSDGDEDKEVLPPPPPAPVIEDSKRVKALRKKLRQVCSFLSKLRRASADAVCARLAGGATAGEGGTGAVPTAGGASQGQGDRGLGGGACSDDAGRRRRSGGGRGSSGAVGRVLRAIGNARDHLSQENDLLSRSPCDVLIL